MLNVSDFLKIADNVYGSVAEDSIVGDVKTWMDSGSYVFNALVSGNIYRGVPANKILGLIGSESTGKTFFALAAAKAFQEKDPNSIILYFDSEGALTRDQLVGRKLDLKRFVSLPVATVQDFKNQAIRIVDKYLEEKNPPPILIILDSLGNLSTTKEMEDSAAGSETKDMTRSQILKAAFRVLSLKLGAANIPFILTNHVYDQIGAGPYAGKEQSGGSGSKYASSITVNLSKAKEKDGDNHIGSIITCTTVKSRLTKEGLKVKALIRFNGGLDRYYGLIDIAEKAGIFKKVSTKYELPDGRKLFGKAIERNPEKYFTPEILEQINEYVQKEFLYGVALDELDNEQEDDQDEQE